MKHIPLTKGKIALVSDEDYQALIQMGRWTFSNVGYACLYTKNADGRRTTLSMHRVVMQRMLGHPVPRHDIVDHISGPTAGRAARLDNQRSNLRLVTRSQSQTWKGKSKNMKLGFKGVCIDGRSYKARLKFDCGKQLHLGMYEMPEMAARVYDYASRLLHGDAYAGGLNYPDEEASDEIKAIVRRFIERNAEAVAFLKREDRYDEVMT